MSTNGLTEILQGEAKATDIPELIARPNDA